MNFKKPLQHLNGLSAEEFIRDYWQKKPLLIRNAFPEFQDPDFNPLSPDELAGLALESDINSRLLTGSHPANDWKVEYGPFAESRFAELPESNWSLLVSDIEKHLPDFQSFIDPFRFIPDWRIDDLMVSYAPKGGSVGQHIDEYDVFLLQTYGQRRWQIEEQRSTAGYIEGLELKILDAFDPSQDWVLNPGDMLYLPPGIAHYGVAENDCMTWSIGFRAPSWQHLLQDLGDTIAETLDESRRYNDGDQPLQGNPAEISQASLKKVRETLLELMNLDNDRFAQWFGNAVSQQACEFPLYPQETVDTDELHQQLQQGRALILSPYVRLCFSRSTTRGYQVHINGETSHIDSPLIETLCRDHRLELESGSSLSREKELLQWLGQCMEKGYWIWEDELDYADED